MFEEDNKNEEIRARKKSKSEPKGDIFLGDLKPTGKRKFLLGPKLATKFNQLCTTGGTDKTPQGYGVIELSGERCTSKPKKPRNHGEFHPNSPADLPQAGASSSSSCMWP